MRYNPKVDVISFRDKANGESTSYTANTVSGFEFFDRKINRRRIYYSLVFDDQGTGTKKPNVFEVLLELETFAVLSRMDPLELRQMAGPGATSPDGITYPAVSSEVTEQDEPFSLPMIGVIFCRTYGS